MTTSDAGDGSGVPLDPDVGARPPHLRPAALGLVFAGGAVGTALRAAIGLAVRPVHGVPFATIGIDVVGALVLGALLELLALRGDDSGARRAVRLALGTGFCGGFTTYSSLALDTGTLLLGGSPGAAAAYAVGTTLLGLLACWVGVRLAGRLR